MTNRASILLKEKNVYNKQIYIFFKNTGLLNFPLNYEKVISYPNPMWKNKNIIVTVVHLKSKKNGQNSNKKFIDKSLKITLAEIF